MAWLNWIYSKIPLSFVTGMPAPLARTMESSRIKGCRGEKYATTFLKGKGYRIIAANFLVRGGEIDIIAKDKDILVFVEVKACSSMNFEDPLAWIPQWKQDRIVRASAIYIKMHGITDTALRFDVVTLGANGEISHIKDAFRPSNRFFM